MIVQTPLRLEFLKCVYLQAMESGANDISKDPLPKLAFYIFTVGSFSLLTLTPNVWWDAETIRIRKSTTLNSCEQPSGECTISYYTRQLQQQGSH